MSDNASDRRHAVLSILSWTGVFILGAVVIRLVQGKSMTRIAVSAAVGLVFALVMSALVLTGAIKVPPRLGPVDELRVKWAVLSGRAVGKPELAGPAVAAAQRVVDMRWLGIIAAPGAAVVLLGEIMNGFEPTGIAILVVAAFVIGSVLNAPRAKAANQALLDPPPSRI